MNPELIPELPHIEFNLRVTKIEGEPRKLQHRLPRKDEPSIVDRLAGVTNPAAADRVAEVDAHNARSDAGEMIDTLWSSEPADDLGPTTDELKGLFDE